MACKSHQKKLQQFYTMAHSGFDVTDDIMRLKKNNLRHLCGSE